jgi:hypothetical protein
VVATSVAGAAQDPEVVGVVGPAPCVFDDMVGLGRLVEQRSVVVELPPTWVVGTPRGVIPGAVGEAGPLCLLEDPPPVA